MRITVTEEDIKNGKARNCSECPVALALRRHGLPHAEVDYDSIHYEGPDGFPRTIEIPDRVYNFVKSFDAGSWLHAHPFEFDLEVPE